MNKLKQFIYLAPEIEVVAVTPQSLVCESGFIEDHDYVDPWTD